MCGIYGWLSTQANAVENTQRLSRLGEIVAHRGPDDQGTFVDEFAGVRLGQNRLSIIDLSSAGHQPMANEDQSVVVTFNGEIYNFQTFRSELEAAGHQFRSRTDTEVLVHGYEQWGKAFVDRLCGMFAFAIWDAKEKTLFLARDPMGIKPLYYWIDHQQGFWFASEIKAFLSVPGFTPKLDHQAIVQYLEFNFIYDSQRCSLQDLRKLPAGHTMTVRAGEAPKITRYFTQPTVEPCVDQQDAIDDRADRLYSVFSEVVGQHLIADVPVGLLLSGGLDSSLVAAVASKYQKLNTLSFAFADSKVDERPFARTVSQHIGSNHQEVVIEPGVVTSDLEESAWYFDDLFGDWGLISTRMLYQQCRERGLKVVLVGEGSDELFGGYRSYDLTQGHRGWLPLSLQLYRWFSGRRWGKEWLGFHRLLQQLRTEAHGDDFSAVRLFETRHQLPNNYNMKVDKASMAASVEARVPFLDVRMAREGFAAPANLLMRNGTNKYLLRRMAERQNLLPPEIIQRAKFGASMAASWMDESPEFRSYAREKILGQGSVTADFGLDGPMRKYFDQGRKGSPAPSGLSIYSIIAWRLLLLNVWAQRYLRTI
jgi:asparagine synthase (glutamine-hydrolysing)